MTHIRFWVCGRPIFIQCRCWGELCSPYEVARPQPSTGHKIVHPWVQKYYIQYWGKGLETGSYAILQTPVLYWINFSFRNFGGRQQDVQIIWHSCPQRQTPVKRHIANLEIVNLSCMARHISDLDSTQAPHRFDMLWNVVKSSQQRQLSAGRLFVQPCLPKGSTPKDGQHMMTNMYYPRV